MSWARPLYLATIANKAHVTVVIFGKHAKYVTQYNWRRTRFCRRVNGHFWDRATYDRSDRCRIIDFRPDGFVFEKQVG
jgi:hypothetical protein